MATSTTIRPEEVTKFEKNVKVTFPKTPKDLKTLTAGMKMIGWSVAAGTCVYFLDRAVTEFDKLTKVPEKKAPVKKAPEKKAITYQDIAKKSK